jgi:hypothetical protein
MECFIIIREVPCCCAFGTKNGRHPFKKENRGFYTHVCREKFLEARRDGFPFIILPVTFYNEIPSTKLLAIAQEYGYQVTTVISILEISSEC